MERVALAMAASCGIWVCALNYGIERQFDRLKVFDQYNVVFETDAPRRLSAFSHGVGDRNFIHPNLRFLFSLPIRLVAKTLVASGLASDGYAIRRSLGLMVAPLLSGMTVFLAFRLFRRLGLSLGNSCLMTLLMGGAFSQLIFGSVPDHFAVSGCILTISYLIAADHLLRGGKVRWGAWLGCGVLAASVTITNLVSVGILFAATVIASRRENPRPVRSIALYVGLACAITYSIALLGLAIESAYPRSTAARKAGRSAGNILEMQDQAGREVPVAAPTAKSESTSTPQRPLWRRIVSSDLKWMSKSWETDNFGKLAQIPSAVANTLAPAEVSTKDNVWRGERYRYQFTLEKTSGTARTVLAAILVATGTWRCLKRPDPLFSLGAASIGILAFNFLMHAVWGEEYFLYSQHWMIALLLLLSGNLACEGNRLVASTGILGLLAACVMANSALLIHEMFRILVATS